MSKFNRYVFRVYNIGQPNDGTKDFFQDKYKGDDALYLQNPYTGNEVDQYNLNNYRKLGKVINYYDKKFPNYKRDFFNRRNIHGSLDVPQNALYDKQVYGNGLYLPHKGISVIGLADPKYSLYDFKDLGSLYRVYRNRDSDDNGALNIEYDTTLEDYLDKQNVWRDIYARASDSGFQDIINEGIKRTGWTPGSSRYITFDNKHFSKDELSKYLKIFDNIERIKTKYLAKLPLLYPEVPDYTDTPYTNMLDALFKTLNVTGANGFVLATVPEDALYTVDDVRKGELRGQRDFPEELVTRRFKPIKAFSALQHVRPNLEDYIDSDGEFKDDEYEEDLSDWYNSLRFGPYAQVDLVQDYDADTYENNKYIPLQDNAIRSGRMKPEEMEKRSKALIMKHFEVDPGEFISDETKKYIYKDLSDWYNKSKEAQKKINDRQKNISNALESWRY